MMKNALKTTLGALALAAVSAFSASAATVKVIAGPGATAANSFQAQLDAAGAGTFYDPSDIKVAKGGVILTFSGVGAESGFANSFVVGDNVISEPRRNNQALSDFTTGFLFGSFSVKFGPGSLANLLTFFANGGAPAKMNDAVDDRFGLYASGTGDLSTFFLAFDDQSQGRDDNHDDLIIRVDVSSVPVPAAGFLLLGALGGLAALRRRKTA